MLEIIRYNSDQKTQWNTFIKESKNGLFFFEREFMDYHADRFTDHSLMVYSEGKLVAVFPANESETTVYSHQGLTFGSLVLSKKIKAVEVLEIFNELMRYYKKIGFKNIIYKAISYVFHRYTSQEDLYALFRCKAQLTRRDISSVVFLKDRLPLSKGKKESYKKCSKLNLEIRQNKNFKEYWKILTEILKANHSIKPVHSIDEIQILADKFPNNIQLFEVLENDKVISGTVIFDFGRTAHSQYLANSERGREIGALDYLIIKLMEERFLDKDYFSLGISSENHGLILNEGLINQKEMYGGRAVCNDSYEIVL